MIKKILLILLILFFSINVEASQTLMGGISYTVDTAKKISFQDVDFELPIASFKDHLKDNTRFKLFRNITIFSDGDYGIYDKKNNRCYYYSSKGELKVIGVILNDTFPKKIVRYDRYGKFDSVTLDIGNNEEFIFDANKKLIAHWKGKNCYNEKGELIKTRD